MRACVTEARATVYVVVVVVVVVIVVVVVYWKTSTGLQGLFTGCPRYFMIVQRKREKEIFGDRSSDGRLL